MADGYYTVSVLTKHAWYTVSARNPVSVHSSSDLLPIVEKLMAHCAASNH